MKGEILLIVSRASKVYLKSGGTQKIYQIKMLYENTNL